MHLGKKNVSSHTYTVLVSKLAVTSQEVGSVSSLPSSSCKGKQVVRNYYGEELRARLKTLLTICISAWCRHILKTADRAGLSLIS